jgi:hypothetical protein
LILPTLGSNASHGDAENFLALAQAFSAWVQMIDDTLDEPDDESPRMKSAKAKPRPRK